ncbi:alpha/beta hydrolase [Sneathiella marina]|uniref:Alpha/beta hydrolase n=1 Tax=Sneathiella marina TaxID=2950108 RepID=A0ABY4WC37_9PROT|nr:alpha/beta hydrolase [Sneathiella marina]USG62216.1 alpha/beta hydrolase [Sneathiella marina]
MYLTVNNQEIFAATGGVEFDKSKPTIVFLHGAGMDHRAWALQTRYFAFHGFSVLAPDLPGHSLSSGEPLDSVEAMGSWLVKVVEAAGAEYVHLVGHSQGFLIALEAAAGLGNRLQSITAVATAASIPVNPALIETAQKSPDTAAGMMLQWGFGQRTQMGMSPVPGQQPIAIGHQIMSSNPLAKDLIACSEYSLGAERSREIKCPTHVILAAEDKMTPVKAGLALAVDLDVKATVLKNAGHMLPVEAPVQCLEAMGTFIQSLEEK